MDPSAEPPQINIVDVPVTDENVSLNLIVQFLNIAQRRGAFSIAESAKIFECIRMFIHPSQLQQSDAEIQHPSEPVNDFPSNVEMSEEVGQEGETPLKE